MIDHYAILTVKEDASQGEIRAAFRRMVKKYHPDLNERRAVWAHRQMKKVLDAYAVLADDAKREVYDRKLNAYRNGKRNLFRERMAERGDPESVARLILYDLLHGNEVQAVAAYERAVAEDAAFDVAVHLPPRDWMDCKFLLGEQYEKRKAHLKALNLYEAIYHSPASSAHYKHFLHEVSERIRRLCCHELARVAEPADAALYYERALRMKLKTPQRAFLHKKIAECHYDAGDEAAALEQMRQALSLKPDLKGCQKICRRLGIEDWGNGNGAFRAR